MVTVTVNYIVYTSGHRRHHAGSQTNLISPIIGSESPGDSFPVTAFPQLAYNNQILPFAFMCVTGSANGSQLFTKPGTQNIPIDENDVNVLIVYAPVGGGGTEPQAYVDAFNVDTGNFSDSDFMDVYTNGVLDPAKSSTANNDGTVSSVVAEDLRSYSSVDGVPFMQWFKSGSNAAINKIDYNLAASETGFVFAFYQSQKKGITVSNVRTRPIVVAPGVAVEYRGNYGEQGELIGKLISTVAILSISSTMEDSLKNEAIDLAVKNLNSIANTIKQGLKTQAG